MTDDYVKLFGRRLLTSSLWQEDSDTVRVWITLLALADKDGMVNTPVNALAREANVTLEACEAAIEKFKAPDPYSRTVAFEGRRIIQEVVDGERVIEILNHGKYREMRSEAQVKEAAKKRRQRKKKRQEERHGTHGDTRGHVGDMSPMSPLVPVDTEAEADTDHLTSKDRINQLSGSSRVKPESHPSLSDKERFGEPPSGLADSEKMKAQAAHRAIRLYFTKLFERASGNLQDGGFWRRDAEELKELSRFASMNVGSAEGAWDFAWDLCAGYHVKRHKSAHWRIRYLSENREAYLKLGQEHAAEYRDLRARIDQEVRIRGDK